MQKTHSDQGEEWMKNHTNPRFLPPGVDIDKWLKSDPQIVAQIGSTIVTKADVIRSRGPGPFYLGGCI